MAENPSGKKGLAREYFEGAMCTGVAYAAGTLASWTISGFPPPAPPTLDITLTEYNKLQKGTLTVG